MLSTRCSGVLLHPSSLHRGHGIGDLGPGAREFVDFLVAAGQSLWQVLPLGPTGPDNSPYQAHSSFAGNPLLISLDALVEDGLLTPADLSGGEAPGGRAEGGTDYDRARTFKDKALREAYAGFCGPGGKGLADAFEAFRKAEAWWLDDYALFAALKDRFGQKPWFDWPDPGVAARDKKALESLRAELRTEIAFHAFCQFCFFRQWRALKKRANERGVRIIGDIPIYCAHDSADVWASPQFFAVTRSGRAELLAGAPPDAYSSTGQLWSNPIYRWDELRADGYAWWIERIRATLDMVDILRIDHFRGFEAYWETPAGARTAQGGKWVKGPGAGFFKAALSALGPLPLIAEDLGVITPEVDALRRGAGLPGMKVLQFAFCEGANKYRPHTYERDCVVYTATHDNDTTRGWSSALGPYYESMDRAIIERERDLLRRYLGCDGSDIAWDMIRLALSSVANLAIAPMQDILDLGGEARMNRPGVPDGQWVWRMTEEQFAAVWTDRLRDLCRLYDRIPKSAKRPSRSGSRDAEFSQGRE